MSHDDSDSCARVVRYGPEDRLDDVVDDPSAGGTYVLVFTLAAPTAVDVGALGTGEFPAGDYAYVGSAFGPGGFSRAERHRRKLDGSGGRVHWHVDALTTLPETSFVCAHLIPDVDAECAVARRLPDGPLEGFGSSDCRCRAHLSVIDNASLDGTLRDAVRTVSSE